MSQIPTSRPSKSAVRRPTAASGPVRLGDKVAAIIAALPPKIAASVQRDTERMLHDSRAYRRETWKRTRDRRGKWNLISHR